MVTRLRGPWEPPMANVRRIGAPAADGIATWRSGRRHSFRVALRLPQPNTAWTGHGGRL